MLLATIDWRESFGVDDITAAAVRPNGETGKVFVCGPDMSGQPVLLMRPGVEKEKACSWNPWRSGCKVMAAVVAILT